MAKTIRKAPPLLTAEELKRMLDDVYDGCIVHLSGTGGVRRIEVVRDRVYIVGAAGARGMRFLKNIKTTDNNGKHADQDLPQVRQDAPD